MKDVWELLRDAVNDLNHTLSVISQDSDDYDGDGSFYEEDPDMQRMQGEVKLLTNPTLQRNGFEEPLKPTTTASAFPLENSTRELGLYEQKVNALFQSAMNSAKSEEYINLLRFIQNLYRFNKTDGKAQIMYPTETCEKNVNPEIPFDRFGRTQPAVQAMTTAEFRTHSMTIKFAISEKQDVLIYSAGLIFRGQMSNKSSFDMHQCPLRNSSTRNINTTVDSKETICCEENQSMFDLGKKPIPATIVTEKEKINSLRNRLDNFNFRDNTCTQETNRRRSIATSTMDSSCQSLNNEYYRTVETITTCDFVVLAPGKKLQLKNIFQLYIHCILNQMKDATTKDVQVSNKTQYVVVRNALTEIIPKRTTNLFDIEKNYGKLQNSECTELVQMKKDNEDLEEQLDVCFLSLQQLQKENGDIRSQLKEAQKNIEICNDLKQQNTLLQIDLDETKKKVTYMDSQETSLKTLRNKVELLKNELDNSRMVAEKMNQLLDDINKDQDATVTNLKKLWMRACDDSERLQAQVNTLQNDLANYHCLKSDYDNLKVLQESLQKEVLNKNCTISELTESLKSLLDRVQSLVEKEFYMIDKRSLHENLQAFLAFLRSQGVINILGRSRDFMCYVLCQLCGLREGEIFLFFGINDSVRSLVEEARLKIHNKSTGKTLSAEEELLQGLQIKNISRLGISDMFIEFLQDEIG
ncbi:uncharacterized protein LOC128882875 isoform X3 [Hylaeus volcanicus]|uniref:uncharacterized protein LOC128882875 isoform X3 n=1 Tax=Hylaeus volcanicus TaxID=313075 RepID=UPI0023B868CC|nr:uncharacterized protein LOC128882875 isoform X3 [Hylaeus volcanicus]